jgi:katanin p60 ATPase-containing subunit A1
LSDKRRNILILINQHLIENGYVKAAERLQHETGNIICKFAVADNVDLGLILGEYEAYYEMRFDKKPKIIRKLRDDEEISRPTGSRLPRHSESAGSLRQVPKCKSASSAAVKLPSVNGATSSSQATCDDETAAAAIEGFGVHGTSFNGTSVDNTNSKQKRLDDPNGKETFEER